MLPVAVVLAGKRLFAFASTPFGQVLCFALLAAAVFVAGDWRGAAREREACRLEKIAMVDEGKRLAKERDDKIRSEAKVDADQRLSALQKIKGELEQKVSAYETELAKVKDRRSCIATPIDERGMHGL